MKRCYLPLGSISEGTLRNEDLIESFGDALESVAPRRYRKIMSDHRKGMREVRRDFKDEIERQSHYGNEFSITVEALGQALYDFCAPYTYFGPHSGDGACFGVWVDHEAIDADVHDGDVMKVNDLSDVQRERPHGYTGMVLHVNDHGNTTLYRCVRNRLYEIWAVV